MITKFKIFEQSSNLNNQIFENVKNDYMLGKDQFFINDVMKYLDIDVDTMIMDEKTELKSKYNIDVIDFIKEILLNKTIIFQNENRIQKNPIRKGKVINVNIFFYKDDFWLHVNLKTPQILIDKKFVEYQGTLNGCGDFLIKNNSIVTIYDYDADNKPLHKLVKLKKETEKYNI